MACVYGASSSGKPELKVSLKNSAGNNDRDDDCSMDELLLVLYCSWPLRVFEARSLLRLFRGVEDEMQDIGFRNRFRALVR